MTDLNIDSTAGSVSGGTIGIEALAFGTGAVSITTADVTGSTFRGINVLQIGGTDLTIDTSTGSVSGGTSGIAVDSSGSGAVSITTAGVTGMTEYGILALVDGGTDTTIDSTAGSVSGGTHGIGAAHVGSGALSVTTADVTGTTGVGIFANGFSGTDVTVDTTAGSVLGGNTGISTFNLGTGALTVTTADVTGTSNAGIVANNSGTGLTVDTSAGSVYGGGTGISAAQFGSGAVSVTTADVTGQTSYGIYANNNATGTDVTVDSSAGSVIGGSIGIRANNFGSGDVTVTTADVTGINVYGISAAGLNGDVTIDSTAGTVIGGTSGISGSTASDLLSITTADVTGTNSFGIFASSFGGIAIDSSAGAVDGGINGISVTNNLAGDVSVVTSDVNAGSLGIIAQLNGGDGNVFVDTTAGSVTGGDAGILAFQFGTGTLTVLAADVTGNVASGIEARNFNGTDLIIDTSAGSVSGGSRGIVAVNDGSGVLSLTTGDVTGGTSDGIYAIANGTDIIIDSSAGSVTGANRGIVAVNNGSDSISITALDVTGGASGIDATVTSGELNISTLAGGTVTGGNYGIYADNGGLGLTTVNIGGTLQAVSGPAMFVTGNAATVNNSGTIGGFITLTANDDVLNNSGSFVASGTSDFGAGIDTLNNSGTVGAGGTASFTQLELFDNSGTVDLVNGAVGSSLTTSGDFVGSDGSTLAVDVDVNGGVADVLTIGGSATGSTAVALNQVGMLSATLASDILLVDAGLGTSETAFAIAGGSQTLGSIEFDILFDSANNDFFLASAPSASAIQLGNLAEGTRNLWRASSDAWSREMAGRRGVTGGGESGLGGSGKGATRFWIAGYGSEIEREQTGGTTVNGITTEFNLDFDQDFFGAQVGVDLGNSVLRYGLTGGFMSSTLGFQGTADRVDFSVLNIGAYVAFDTGPVFANALVKYDNVSGDFKGPAAAFASDADGSVFGLSAELGALLGDRAGFFAEPIVSLSYLSADLDDIETSQGSFDFDEGEGIVGKIGGRIGSGLEIGSTSGNIFVGGHYVHEFDGEDAVIFSSGGQDVAFSNTAIGDYGELFAGVSIGESDDKVSGAIEAQYATGGDIDGFGASANIRFRF